MAYEKTTWVSGETALSADNMNNIEDGIEILDNQLGNMNNLITDFNDTNFIKSFYKQTSMTILPFSTGSLNQPNNYNTWGFCGVYFGGNTEHFILFYVNSAGHVCIRPYIDSSWQNWVTVN